MASYSILATYSVLLCWSVTCLSLYLIVSPCKGNEQINRREGVPDLKKHSCMPGSPKKDCYESAERKSQGNGEDITRKRRSASGLKIDDEEDGDDISNMDSRRKLYNDFLRRILRKNRGGKKSNGKNAPKQHKRKPTAKLKQHNSGSSSNNHLSSHERKRRQKNKQKSRKARLGKETTTTIKYRPVSGSESALHRQKELDELELIKRNRNERLRRWRELHMRQNAVENASNETNQTDGVNETQQSKSRPKLSLSRRLKPNNEREDKELVTGEQSQKRLKSSSPAKDREDTLEENHIDNNSEENPITSISSTERNDKSKTESVTVVEISTSPFLSASTAKDYLTRLDNTFQRKKFPRRRKLKNGVKEEAGEEVTTSPFLGASTAKDYLTRLDNTFQRKKFPRRRKLKNGVKAEAGEEVTTSPFLGASTAKDYLTRLDNTFQRKKFPRRRKLMNGVKEEAGEEVTSPFSVNPSPTPSVDSQISNMAKNQQGRKGHESKSGSLKSKRNSKKRKTYNVRSLSKRKWKHKPGSSLGKTGRGKKGSAKTRRNRRKQRKHRKNKNNRRRRHRKRKHNSRHVVHVSTSSWFSSSAVTSSTLENNTPSRNMASSEKKQYISDQRKMAYGIVSTTTSLIQDTSIPTTTTTFETVRNTPMAKSKTAKLIFSALKSHTDSTTIKKMLREHNGPEDYNTVTTLRKESRPTDKFNHTTLQVSSQGNVHSKLTTPSFVLPTTASNNVDVRASSANDNPIGNKTKKEINVTTTEHVEGQESKKYVSRAMASSFVNIKSKSEDPSHPSTGRLETGTTSTIKNSSIVNSSVSSDLSSMTDNTSQLNNNSRQGNMNENVSLKKELSTNVPMVTPSSPSLIITSSTPSPRSKGSNITTGGKFQTSIALKQEEQTPSPRYKQSLQTTRSSSTVTSTTSQTQTTATRSNVSRWLSWAKKRRDRAKTKKTKSKPRSNSKKTPKLPGNVHVARGSVAISLTDDKKTLTTTEKRFLEEPSTTKGPFVGYKTAYDFLSNQKGLNVRILSEERRESHIVNTLMGENMCEIFNKHYVPTKIGGRCV